MTSFSGLGIGLSLVFGCLLFALVAELYYLLWWKKRSLTSEVEDEFTNYAKEFFHLICWKRASSSSSSSLQDTNSREIQMNPESDIENGSSKDLLLKSSSVGGGGGGEEGVELELMRLHNLAGPPRFLFTIKEETKEDLESAEADRSRKGSRTRSLSDLILTVDTPFLTPLPSPPLKAPSPLNPLSSSFKHHGFNINPLFESSSPELDLNRLLSSPPPKFRFLREAEEKLYRRLMEEAQKKACKINGGSVQNSETKSISNPTAAVDEEEEKDGFCCTEVKEPQNHYHVSSSQYSSSSSQVLPLASSPPPSSEHRFSFNNVLLDKSL